MSEATNDRRKVQNASKSDSFAKNDRGEGEWENESPED